MKKIILLILVGLILGGCNKTSTIKTVKIVLNEWQSSQALNNKKQYIEILKCSNSFDIKKEKEILFQGSQTIEVPIVKEFPDYYLIGNGWVLDKNPDIISYNLFWVAYIWEDDSRVKEGKLCE